MDNVNIKKNGENACMAFAIKTSKTNNIHLLMRQNQPYKKNHKDLSLV